MPVQSVRRAAATAGALVALVAAGVVAAPVADAAASTFTVNTTTDAIGTAGDGRCDTSSATGDQCTLREAISESNANTGRDTITFAVGLVSQTAAGFPAITDAVTIQGGARLDGALRGLDGLVVRPSAPGTVIRGLTLTRFANAVVLEAEGATVAGTSLGLVSSSSSTLLGNDVGVLVRGGDAGVIGGATATDRNVIAHNVEGVRVEDADTTSILGNHVGVRTNGTVAAGNARGVVLDRARGTVVAANTISANTTGVADEGSADTVLRGNQIGTNAAGTGSLGGTTGVELFYTGETTVTGNTIVGQTDYGLYAAGPVDLTLTDNVVGLATGGTTRLANQYGVYVPADSGTVTMRGNTVAGSTLDGVYLQNVDVDLVANVVGSPTTATTLGNAGDGLSLQDVTGQVRDNTVSGNGANGVNLAGSFETTLAGNRVGTDAAGAVAVGNGADGIRLCDTTDTLVEANLASGNGGSGVHLTCQSIENTVRTNVVGRGADRVAVLPNAADGIALDDNSDRNEVSENLVADNGGAGVLVDFTSNSNRLLANALTANTGLGIDLGADDVTPNDALDRDSGANALQNFPVLTRAGSDGTTTQVRGTLATRASGGYRLDFYASATCDVSGYGEAARWLGSASVSTTTLGRAAFDVSLPTGVAAGQQVTATATDLRREDTSELSACLPSLGFPVATIDDVTTTEPDDGTTSATFTVSLSAPATVPARVRVRTVAGTATAGTDFTAVDTVVTFAPGETSKQVTVPVVGDGVEEVTEGYTVELSEPDALTIGDTTGAGSILDGSPRLTVSVDDTTVDEPAPGTSGDALVTIRLSRPSLRPVTVAFATAPGTARPLDYVTRSGSVTIPAGSTTATAAVKLRPDAVDEPDEVFSVVLTSADVAAVEDGQGDVTIRDVTPTPVASIGDTTVIEGAPGRNTTLTFTVTLTNASSTSVAVRATTADGTAIAPTDYLARTATVTLPAGSLTRTFTVTARGDTLDEPDETLTVALSDPIGVVLEGTPAVGTIVDDD